jgi:NADH-quinone oxidoreductase subunit J
MDIKSIVFFLLAGFTLISALLSVSEKKIFRAAIYLLFTMMGIAGIYFWLDYEFIAAVQIVVYVGGIVVLIIFSIFLTHHVGSEMEAPDRMRLSFSLLAAAFAFAYCFIIIRKNVFPVPTGGPAELSINEIGTQMLSTTEHGYILPFEVVSMLLLAAMVGCIVIALKPLSNSPLKGKG